MHVGDLAYADGRHKTWDAFMQAIEPVASRLPWMVRSCLTALPLLFCAATDAAWQSFGTSRLSLVQRLVGF